MSSRRSARRGAVEILYQADLTGQPPEAVLDGWREAGRSVAVFSCELVEGVSEHAPEIDLLLEEHADRWSVSRMTALDRTILRVAVFELLHRPDVPASVAISEAMEAVTELSSDEARKFVNGVLAGVAREIGPAAGSAT